jgi:hypothetical protein
MTIVIKVSDEHIAGLIRQLGEEFSLQAERRLGTPDGEGKERKEDDGENQKSLSHLRSPAPLKKFAHRLKSVAAKRTY